MIVHTSTAYEKPWIDFYKKNFLNRFCGSIAASDAAIGKQAAVKVV
jgi:hypothetical protein